MADSKTPDSKAADSKIVDPKAADSKAPDSRPTGEVLDRLYQTVLSRKGADPNSSYTAKLYARGVPKIAQKVGEEAVEAVIEAMRGDPEMLAAESADLLYHLTVLWAAVGLEPAEVYKKLVAREGTSGIDEKKSRK